jgi:hypothetical protein
MSWHPLVKIDPKQIDIYHPSFPWKNGKPDWPLYLATKAEERFERNKRKARKAPEFVRNHCMFIEQSGRMGVCGVKAFGMMEIEENGQMRLVPLCEKHKRELAA